MPIAISLDGRIMNKPEVTEQQRNLIHTNIVLAYVRAHPEELLNLGKQKAGETHVRSD